MSDESRSLGIADTNVVESQNWRGIVLIGTGNRLGETALKLRSVDRLDLQSLREGKFTNIAIPSGIRSQGNSILQPSGAVVLTSGKRKRSKSGVDPVEKRVRKKEDVIQKESAMPNEGSEGKANAEVGCEGVSVVGNDGQDRSVTTLARANAEMLLLKATTEEIRLCNRVEHGIVELIERVHIIRPNDEEEHLSDADIEALNESRTDTLIHLLSELHHARGSIQKSKGALLQTMCLECVRKDENFKHAVLEVFMDYMKPLSENASLHGANAS